ncbi:hypothetical protein WA026_021738 [Henosepilachna vigintioctopunctata]|uniref:MADF domain-containing protein n=1 Tax=Henosepilachna vigintioctopunctata TaxID=420089 RepID=A0AAW1TY18_9CUCU
MYKTVKTIDPALLIEEVKKRPLLYDSRVGVVTTEARRSTWFEVSEIFIQNFPYMTPVEKENISREMQAKWKSLRDSYRRTIRIEERDRRLGITPGRRSKYYYFEQLNFLAEHCGPKGASRGSFKIEKSENENSTDLQDSNGSTTLDPDDSNNGFVPYHFLPVETEVSTPISEEPPRKKTKLQDTKCDINERLVKVLEEITEFQKCEKADNPMGNKNFLLSLLPFMENLTNEENLQVRVHFMNILQTYNNNANCKREQA